MQLVLVPNHSLSQPSTISPPCEERLLATIKHMQNEIDRLKTSKLALDEAKRLILTQQLAGIETALDLAGFSLIYR